jgi:hypothetical protein
MATAARHFTQRRNVASDGAVAVGPVRFGTAPPRRPLPSGVEIGHALATSPPASLTVRRRSVSRVSPSQIRDGPAGGAAGGVGTHGPARPPKEATPCSGGMRLTPPSVTDWPWAGAEFGKTGHCARHRPESARRLMPPLCSGM